MNKPKETKKKLNNTKLTTLKSHLSIQNLKQADDDKTSATKPIDHYLLKNEKFFRTLKKAQGKKLLICLKGFPDPDNIASALALAWLTQPFKIKTKIVYFDDITAFWRWG